MLVGLLDIKFIKEKNVRDTRKHSGRCSQTWTFSSEPQGFFFQISVTVKLNKLIRKHYCESQYSLEKVYFMAFLGQRANWGQILWHTNTYHFFFFRHVVIKLSSLIRVMIRTLAVVGQNWHKKRLWTSIWKCQKEWRRGHRLRDIGDYVPEPFLDALPVA